MRFSVAALLFCLPTVAQAAQAVVAQAVRCRGEEPFWALDATTRTGRFSTPGRHVVLQGRLDELDWLPPGWLVWRGVGSEPLTITLRAESCASTMADTPPLDYRAILVRGSAPAAAGCCSVTRAYDALAAPVAAAADKPSDDWTRLLPDLLQGIQRCVGESGVAVAEVSRAWPMNHGMIGARLVDGKGGRHDCIVELGTGRIDRLAAADENRPGEGGPVFLPAAEEPPLVASGSLERVMLPSGAVAGWLRYRD